MQETAEQYTRRMLGYIEGKEPMAILSATPRQIARLIEGLPRKALSKQPGPGTWSVAEILAHLADSELVYGYRIRLILEGGTPQIQATEQDKWAAFSGYATHDPRQSLEAFRVARERLIRLLKRLPRESWELYGMHSERGRETVRRVVEMLSGHDVNHLTQIKERLPKR